MTLSGRNVRDELLSSHAWTSTQGLGTRPLFLSSNDSRELVAIRADSDRPAGPRGLA